MEILNSDVSKSGQNGAQIRRPMDWSRFPLQALGYAVLNGATATVKAGSVSYVEWHTTVIGPDCYGPEGGSPF